jgi:hypothetical protein
MSQYDFLPPASRLLRELGLRFGFADPECEELEIDYSGFSEYQLRQVLERYEKAIKNHLRFEQQRRLEICVGGPFNGRRHPQFVNGALVLFHVGRAKWAVYQVADVKDRRAWFRGYATSRAKARRMELVRDPQPPTPSPESPS